MGFTTPCFIRKNTPELRSKLESFGYKNCITEEGPYIFTLRSVFDCMHSECGLSDLAYNGIIDCGDNEELFVAIVALRDDTDIHQWFTDGKKWVMSDVHTLIELKEYFEEIKFDYSKTHKATLEELITHFKI